LNPPDERSRKLRPRAVLEDLALLLIATLILVLPAWLRSTPPGPGLVEGVPSAPARIDINRAAWYEWMLLDGIGEARARAIAAHRAEHGPFRSIDDLKAVPRMPAGWVERAREHLVVGEAEGAR
jgi:competence protein ComEA